MPKPQPKHGQNHIQPTSKPHPKTGKKTPKNARTQQKNSKQNSNKTSQVRIIGGMHKRRQIAFIDADGLRPTPDRLRETLFNWLTPYLHDTAILDTCAGSGVLGLEALSRGARHCTFIEANPLQSAQIAEAIRTLSLDEQSTLLTGKAEQLIPQLPMHQPHFDAIFDVVFIDPPYALELWQPLLEALIKSATITADSLIYLEGDRTLERMLPAFSSVNSSTCSYVIHCLKQSKVGQIHAYLLQLLPNTPQKVE